MKIAVVLRQLPDLIEPLELSDSGTEVNLEDATFLPNEYDEHALEQALLLKEQLGGSVTVVALDFGDVDNTLYSASAKGADQIVKIPYEEEMGSPSPKQLCKLFAPVIQDLQADLVLVGVQAFDELEGNVAPLLAHALRLPYAGLIQGIEPGSNEGTLIAYKEYPAAAKARMRITLPALLGILTASQPPRYVPISRIRQAMKSADFDEATSDSVSYQPQFELKRYYPPEVGERAQILEGDSEQLALKVIEILQEKGVLK